jgi:hypothetical protein
MDGLGLPPAAPDPIGQSCEALEVVAWEGWRVIETRAWRVILWAALDQSHCPLAL